MERNVKVGRSSVENQKKVIAEWAQIFAKYDMNPPKAGLVEMFDELVIAADKHLVFQRGERIAEVLGDAAHALAFDKDLPDERAMLAGAILEQAQAIAWAVNEDREEDVWKE